MRNALLSVLFAAACGGHSSAPAPAAPDTHQDTGMSAAQCTAAGGEVVGDIGDGAIHRPEYTCPKSGQPPLGHITAEPGGPVAIEGSVCCK